MSDFRIKSVIRKRVKFIYLLCCALVIITVAGAFFNRGERPHAYKISLSIGHTGETLFEKKITPGNRLILEYIHSADGTPVSSLFEIETDGLMLIEERYSWYGSGLESGSGYSFLFEGDNVIISGYSRLFTDLPLRVARTVNQKIIFEDEVVNVNELAPGGTLIIISVVKY
ncbi:MAG: DUF1850 domain-containing protein [Bacillota bacterium]|nr:DUF1850 domain-containing protein [Bacillota bacterium]MDW7728891.1 DUF1850 domain-containing protein [Bacillota bacterium]